MNEIVMLFCGGCIPSHMASRDHEEGKDISFSIFEIDVNVLIFAISSLFEKLLPI